MSDLMNTLYSHIQNNLLGWTRRNPEYQSHSDCAERQERKLRALLNEEELKILDAFLDEQSDTHSIEQEAVFQAAVALCRELNGMLLL